MKGIRNFTIDFFFDVLYFTCYMRFFHFLWQVCKYSGQVLLRCLVKIRYLVVLILTVLIINKPVMAEIPTVLRNSEFSYQNSPASLGKVLEDFSQAFSLRLVIDKDISGEVKNKIRATTALKFLERLALEYRLQWFIFEGKLYISSLSDQQSLRIKVAKETVDGLKKALTDIGLLDPRFGWGELSDSAEILVSGPAQYVSLIKNFSEQPEPTETKSDQREGMFFPLRFAEAADRQVTCQNETIITPGVGTILTRLLIQKNTKSRPQPVFSPEFLKPALENEYIKNKLDPFLSNYSQLTMPGSAQQMKADENVRVVVDARNNAILIYGHPSKRDEYARLINELDVPLQLVSVDTLVVDIDTSSALPLEMRTPRFKSGKSVREKLIRGETNLLTAQELKRLHSEIQQLADRGEASFVARPSLITMENSPAIFNVNSGGPSLETNDASASSDETIMQITPRIISSQGGDKFQVKLNVHYGNRLSLSGDNDISGGIKTFFEVKEGDSLVIGGLFVNENRSINKHVRENLRRERFFIITPSKVYAERDTRSDEEAKKERKNKPARKGAYSEATYQNIIKDIVKLSSNGIVSSGRNEADELTLQDVCAIHWPFSAVPGNIKSLATRDYKIFSSLLKNTGQQQAIFDVAECDDDENIVIVPDAKAAVLPGSLIEVYVVSKNTDADGS